ncbi:STAS domain-containing protein [Shewanella sp. A3A]|nr:STAS domain-containing protein [Shewanella ferrihydritica]
MLTHHQAAGIDTVSFAGEMTIYDIENLATAFMPLVGQAGNLVVDLKEVTEIDSSGAQLLMMARLERQRLDKAFSLVNHSVAVVNLFKLLGLLNWFDDPVLLSGDA